MSAELIRETTTLQIAKGQVIAYFAFDVGYEVSLDQVRELLPSFPAQPLSRKKQTPTYLQYTQAPQVLYLGESNVLEDFQGQIQATVFDFGAVSISYRWQLADEKKPFPLKSLPNFSKHLYYDLDLEQDARRQVEALVQKIKPAITRPEISDLVEDYFVFTIEQFDRLVKAQDLLDYCPSTLAKTLQFDTEELSRKQQQDALSNAISYYERDLVLTDWNAAIVYDSDYTDTLSVLELLNAELLEARYMDAQLDKRIKNYERLVQKPSRWHWPLSNPYWQAINELAELRIESAVLAERVDNALKLIGDLYLARIHSAVSEQFYMPAWDASISRKLEIINNLYQMLTDRVNTAQAQTLELIIILLIGLEIFLNLLH
ncbi:MAG TPA: hypothetical protein V6C99_11120 [Oculatellaceae cyanobacterium]